MEQLRGETFCRFMLWDSSPQYHRDYELILVESVSSLELPDLWGHLEVIAEESLHDDFDTLTPDQKHAAALASMSSIRQSLQVHALPATQIGFGASGFSAKAASLLHALRLEHFTDEGTSRCVSEIRAVVSDGGVESLLTRACPMVLSEMLPYFEDTSAKNVEALLRHSSFEEEDVRLGQREIAAEQPLPEVFEDAPIHAGAGQLAAGDEQVFEAVPEIPVADFQASFPIPGMLHIIHNATKGLTSVLASCEDNLEKATKVCKLLSERGLSIKLQERCYFNRGPLGRELARPLKGFNARIYSGRWGTLAFAMQQLLAIEGPLRWGWDRQAFLGNRREAADGNGPGENVEIEEADADAQPDPGLVATCDGAIRSEFFWSWIRLMEIISSMLREVEES